MSFIGHDEQTTMNVTNVCDLIDGFSEGDSSFNIAVCDQSKSIDYMALKQQSDQFARQLLRWGVTRTSVAIRMLPGVDLVVAMLGVLKAGNAYIPIPLDVPKKRVIKLYETDGIDVEIVSDAMSDQLCGDRSFSFSNLAAAIANDISLPTIKSDDAIYIIYTSGSTGSPKGVVVEHGNVMFFLQSMASVVPSVKPMSGTMICSYGFDVSVWEIFSMLTRGGALHILGDIFISKANLFASYIRREKIQACYIPPGLLQETINYWANDTPEDLMLVLVGVEPISQTVLQPLSWIAPNITIINGYGPTETTVCATAHVVTHASPGDTIVPIGKPLPGYTTYIDNEDTTGTGELVIGGSAVARGYCNNQAATESAFFSNGGQRFYRTGDRVRRRKDGGYDFLSRVDEQIKINGFRIEPGDITSALESHDAVNKAVVLTIRTEGPPYLAAFVESDKTVQIASLRQHLFSILPKAMVPPFIQVLKTFPLTSRGKIDRNQLQDNVLKASESQEELEHNSLTLALMDIWQSELNCELAVSDNFFLVGGSSLAAIRIAASCAEQSKRAVSADSLFRFPKFSEFVSHVASLPEEQKTLTTVCGDDERLASQAEQDLWMFAQVAPADALTERVCITISGEISNQLHACVQRIIERHPLLRSRMYFDDARGGVWVAPYPQYSLGVNEYNVDSLGKPLDLAIDEMGRCAYDPLRPGVQLLIVHSGPRLCTLVFSVSHLFFDGWSARIFFDELVQLTGTKGDTKARTDKVIGTQAASPIALSEQHIARYSECDFLALPYDQPIETKRSYRGRSLNSVLPEQATTCVKRIARQYAVTEYTAILALFLAFMDRFRQSEFYGIAVPVSTRRTISEQAGVGCFATLVPILLQHGQTKTIETIVKDVAAQLRTALSDAVVSHGQVAKYFHDKSYQTCTPLTQVVVAEDIASQLSYKNYQWEFTSFRPTSVTSKFDITLFVGIQSERMTLCWEYASDLFSDVTIASLKRDFEEFIEVFSTNNIALAEVDGFSTADAALLASINETRRSYPNDASLITLFIQQVALVPDKIAITAGTKNVSYLELDRYSNQIASQLVGVVAGVDTAVMVVMEDSVAQIAGLLAVLKTGAFYVPVDASTPPERIALMVEVLQPKCLLIDGDRQVSLSGDSALLDNEFTVIALDDYIKPDSFLCDSVNMISVSATSPAYAMFTSGTSGTPKCVLVPHKAVARLVLNNSFAELTNEDSFARIANIGFDAATFEIWGALLNGGRLVLVDKETKHSPTLLCAFLQSQHITAGFFTVTLFSRLVDTAPEKLSGIRHLVVGGEQVPAALFRRAAQFIPVEHLLNGYGPTENTTFSCYHRPDPRDFTLSAIPIGKPISNSTAFVVDQNNRPVARGVKGEILVGGDGLAIGYLNDPLLTRQRFIDIDNRWLQGRFYRTGDYGRYNCDGELEYIGRGDRQVKIRGFRVELQDVEVALAQLIGGARVSAAVVQGVAGKEIFTFVETAAPANTVELNQRLRSVLPSYMVPARLVFVNAFPMTANGKIDTNLLVAQEKQALAMLPQQADVPLAPAQQHLLSIWRRVLSVNNISVDDNFFEVGGNSLSMVMVKERIAQEMQIELSTVLMFEHPTVNSLAGYIKSLQRPTQPTSLDHEQSREKSMHRKSRIAKLRQRNHR